MRHQTITLYRVDELSDEAKDAAHYDYLANHYHYPWIDESIGSIKAFLKCFGGRIKDYSLGTSSHPYIDFIVDERPWCEVTIDEIKAASTGFNLYESMVHHYMEFLKDKTSHVVTALIYAINKARDEIVQDMEHNESMGQFEEVAEANEWEFYSDGRMYNE